MPQHASTLQLIGAAALTVAGVVWAVAMTRLVRRARVHAVELPSTAGLQALPHQRQAGPDRESVELTSAEQDAFAVLVRRLRDR